jgi:hypothetical protein
MCIIPAPVGKVNSLIRREYPFYNLLHERSPCAFQTVFESIKSMQDKEAKECYEKICLGKNSPGGLASRLGNTLPHGHSAESSHLPSSTSQSRPTGRTQSDPTPGRVSAKALRFLSLNRCCRLWFDWSFLFLPHASQYLCPACRGCPHSRQYRLRESFLTRGAVSCFGWGLLNPNASNKSKPS